MDSQREHGENTADSRGNEKTDRHPEPAAPVGDSYTLDIPNGDVIEEIFGRNAEEARTRRL